jgi:FAD/FMN-containing dehydrogenase
LKTKVTSWGNTSKKTVEILDDFYSNSSPVVACGNNNSYGDAAFSASNYAIKYKKNNKTLLTVNQTIEDYITNTKVSLFGIPGKRNVTLAGAVASDVHGKDNLWGGSFIKNIDQITLKTSSGKITNYLYTKNTFPK